MVGFSLEPYSFVWELPSWLVSASLPLAWKTSNIHLDYSKASFTIVYSRINNYRYEYNWSCPKQAEFRVRLFVSETQKFRVQLFVFKIIRIPNTNSPFWLSTSEMTFADTRLSNEAFCYWFKRLECINQNLRLCLPHWRYPAWMDRRFAPPVLKPEKSSSAENYPPIEVLPLPARITSAVVAKRMELWEDLHDDQAGFRSGRCTTDQLSPVYCPILSND